MPNGVSCAFFAVKNYEYGKQNKDIFRDGIAGAQTARTVNSIAKSAHVVSPVTKTLGKIANFATIIVYPLIISSGIYTTVKSDDKIKTGCEQAGGISVMYVFEQTAKKALKAVENQIKNSESIPCNKLTKFALYFLKGVSFIAASMSGFALGKNAGGDLVDFFRGKKDISAKSQPVPDLKPDDIYSDFTEFLDQDNAKVK